MIANPSIPAYRYETLLVRESRGTYTAMPHLVAPDGSRW